MNDDDPGRSTLKLVIFVLICICGINLFIATELEDRFNAACEKVGGVPAYDGRQRQCLRREK